MESLILLRIVIAAACLVALAGTASAEPAGFRRMQVERPQAAPFGVTLWYPAAKGGIPASIGQTGIFAPQTANQDAPIRDGQLPTVLLMHGGLRSSPDSGAWLAHGLAQAGFLVLDLQSPKADSDAALMQAVWDRPDAANHLIDQLRQDPDWRDRIAWHNLGALGFFLGGTSAIALGGGRLDAAAYQAVCETGQGVDCAMWTARGLDPTQTDAAALGRDRRNPAVGSVLVVAPEYGFAFDADSLAGMPVPAGAVALGKAPFFDTSPLIAHGFQAIPFRGAPYDAFPLCRDDAAAILAEEAEDPALCGDRDSRIRAHAALTDRIVGFFRTHMPRD